jgi:hypothetical protein
VPIIGASALRFTFDQTLLICIFCLSVNLFMGNLYHK